MKAYKKIISFILTLVMMLSLSVNVFAAEPLTDDPNMIEWKYTVFANESLQKVVEEGVIPNFFGKGKSLAFVVSHFCPPEKKITVNYTLY